MKHQRRFPILAIAAPALLAAVLSTSTLAQTAQRPATPAPVALATGGAAEYRLGSGDALKITVFQNADMALETRVSEAGTISFPLLGVVRIGGLTVSEAEAKIADGLKKGNFVKQPQVTILVIKVVGNQASVLGQVNQPGRYPLEVSDTRLTDLLANARGVASSGSDTLVLSGARGGKPFRLEIDLPTLFGPNGREQDIVVQNGDVLWVDRFPMVYIYGEVQKPGQIRLERGMTLLQGLAAGGGLTLRGTDRGIRVHRKDDSGKVQEIKPAMDESLRNGDVIFVRESLF
ncbi:polysaccharide export protein EpsE [Roseateles sp.]|uniref:polysaccharide export protein EpsE n=1 Tax=Roseateles sp. TaxID=1971397 RepID=UPI002F41EC90